jgi:hypothetical protein
MKGKTVLENFLKMTPQVPNYGARNQHFLIAGADPLYYLGQPGAQEQQVGPLAAALDLIQITASINGNIVDMVASTEGTYSVYAITDTTKVYGITETSVTDLGYPTGSSVNNVGGRLAVANNIVFAAWSFGTGSNEVYKMTQPSSSWTTCASTIQNDSGTHILEPFLDYVAISDSDGPGITNHLVRTLSVTSFSIDIGIDIGHGWGVMLMKNFNSKYLAIAAGQVSQGGVINGYPQNYLFLWDGISDRYNYSVPIPGKFLDMKVIDAVLYVAVQVSNTKTVLYYLDNTSLKKVSTTQISNISSLTYAPINCAIFNYNNYVGLKLSNTTPTNGSLTNPLLALGQDDGGGFEYIFGYGRVIDQLCVGYDGTLFANQYVPTGNSNVFYKPDSGSVYLPLFYLSQWIPVESLSTIDVYYDTPPQRTGDQINVTIYGRGEDISGGASTTVLTSITLTSAVTPKRTPIDLQGFTGDFVKVQISTVIASGSPWVPIIRGIVPNNEEQ